MKKLMTAAALLTTLTAAAQWHPAGDRIKTSWGEGLDPANVLAEYPRPQMVRGEWQNLNGLWNYAIRPAGEVPVAWDGEILVPFAAESSLSGVGRRVGAEQELWYERSFTIPAKWSGRRVLLHFGAVDWRADVWVNGVSLGRHEGGYTPFDFDVTPALQKGVNTLRVRVWDPTDAGCQPRGKQVNNPEVIWYTPVTGIWQTVWLEAVPQQYIRSVVATPDLDRRTFRVAAAACGTQPGDRLDVTLLDGGAKVASASALCGADAELYVASPKLWSPSSPHLYDLEIALVRGGRVLDRVTSYAAMRKFSTGKDRDGIVRLRLNDEPLFQFGPLDQGWWPDGLYTAPTDEALVYDIEKTREWGFNMIRKHIKVEPARWYRKEWREIIDALRGFVSIGVWVPFNEAWGQFKTVEIAEWTKAYDPTRLVNPASGGNHYQTGDMLDLHNYPDPSLYLYDANRATVLGEYGGIGLVMKEHLWEPDRNWGYVSFSTPEQVTDEYEKYAAKLGELIGRGFSAAVYTQTTDVEIEVNGLMTYDRKAVKVDEGRIRKINEKICNSLNEKK